MTEFVLLDKIVEWEPNKYLKGTKLLSLSEEYLQDHFPGYPVMPGVMMLEALVQSAAWLLRASTDFAHPMVTLVEARNVKFSKFLLPGQRLDTYVSLISKNGDLYEFQGSGSVNATNILGGKFTLRYYDFSEINPAFGTAKEPVIKALKEMFRVLTGQVG